MRKKVKAVLRRLGYGGPPMCSRGKTNRGRSHSVRIEKYTIPNHGFEKLIRRASSRSVPNTTGIWGKAVKSLRAERRGKGVEQTPKLE